ncbi:hypothetical protein ACN38_g12276 [Penicillium nordicum]|uniref:Uncharacterized protein n=1 Tax=Penicillium nordicum TaxID=229535 RepID=A0A0M8NTH3_9EURO|nr:hypothetical protein ACN38_g12276 [Penicillium nordicum]
MSYRATRDLVWGQGCPYNNLSKCKVAYMDLHGIIPWRSCDFEYWIYHILRLVIITAQIVEIAGFVILEKKGVLNISRGAHTVQYRQISVTIPYLNAKMLNSGEVYKQVSGVRLRSRVS